MSKAVLVMDMPESCSKCMFLYEFSGIKNCSLMNVMYGGVSRLSQSNSQNVDMGNVHCVRCQIKKI